MSQSNSFRVTGQRVELIWLIFIGASFLSAHVGYESKRVKWDKILKIVKKNLILQILRSSNKTYIYIYIYI